MCGLGGLIVGCLFKGIVFILGIFKCFVMWIIFVVFIILIIVLEMILVIYFLVSFGIYYGFFEV